MLAISREANLSSDTKPFGDRVCFIALSTVEDERGRLIEFDHAAFPFAPRRSFIVDGVPSGMSRGGHLHKRADQVLVCLSGRLSVELIAGGRSATIDLGPADGGLFIGAGIWARQTYLDAGTQMLVFSSTEFDSDDYQTEPR